MKKSLAVLAAVATAGAAGGQTWELEIDNPMLRPGSPATTVTASIDPGPGFEYVAAANFAVHASEGEWSDLVATTATRTPPVPGQSPGAPLGSSVTGIRVGQLSPIFGFTPEPGRIDLWSGTLTITDFSVIRDITIETQTSRFDVFITPWVGEITRETRPVTEGRAVIRSIPAPGAMTLLGVAGLAVARRRRSSV